MERAIDETLEQLRRDESGTHGEYGEPVNIEQQNGSSFLRVSSFARWCERCREWVKPTGVTSMIVATVACPRCSEPWKSSDEPDPRAGVELSNDLPDEPVRLTREESAMLLDGLEGEIEPCAGQ